MSAKLHVILRAPISEETSWNKSIIAHNATLKFA